MNASDLRVWCDKLQTMKGFRIHMTVCLTMGCSNDLIVFSCFISCHFRLRKERIFAKLDFK